MSQFISSVLQKHDHRDTTCSICRFLDGDRSRYLLLSIIETLDEELAITEESERMLLKRLGEEESSTR